MPEKNAATLVRSPSSPTCSALRGFGEVRTEVHMVGVNKQQLLTCDGNRELLDKVFRTQMRPGSYSTCPCIPAFNPKPPRPRKRPSNGTSRPAPTTQSALRQIKISHETTDSTGHISSEVRE
ncbi:hypothetical protein DPEC_G00024110 [Dallia pectoralis]|uniref:Uncharacterized protein n=1 Tax=Dallia pectoralis TaxID=75939 RepID=A0ACC2HHB3_DALPE|nr:hypothetical protein DPEC_G00024110 [Dallia pectoralis]